MSFQRRTRTNIFDTGRFEIRLLPSVLQMGGDVMATPEDTSQKNKQLQLVQS